MQQNMQQGKVLVEWTTHNNANASNHVTMGWVNLIGF